MHSIHRNSVFYTMSVRLLATCSLTLVALATGCDSNNSAGNPDDQSPPDLQTVMPPPMPPMSTCTMNCGPPQSLTPTPAQMAALSNCGQVTLSGQNAVDATYAVEVTGLGAVQNKQVAFIQPAHAPTDYASCLKINVTGTLYGHNSIDNQWYVIGQQVTRKASWQTMPGLFGGPPTSTCDDALQWNLNDSKIDAVIISGSVLSCVGDSCTPVPLQAGVSTLCPAK